MSWKGVTVTEQRQRFLEDYQLNYYSIAELAGRFCISRNTAHKWINRFNRNGQNGFSELSRRPQSCPWQTDTANVEELVDARKAHPKWGPKKLIDLMERRDSERKLPAISTAALILVRKELVKPRRRYRRAHPGSPKSVPQRPNDIWAADNKGSIPSEEREILLSIDGQRSLVPLYIGHRCPPCDLAGEDISAFYRCIPRLRAPKTYSD